VIDIGRILVLADVTSGLLNAGSILLTPAPPGGHHERFMQGSFGEWYVSIGRCPG
jgi:hypothetical protein